MARSNANSNSNKKVATKGPCTRHSIKVQKVPKSVVQASPQYKLLVQEQKVYQKRLQALNGNNGVNVQIELPVAQKVPVEATRTRSAAKAKETGNDVILSTPVYKAMAEETKQLKKKVDEATMAHNNVSP